MNTELHRNGELCPACGEGHLNTRVQQEQVDYNGRQGFVPLRFSVCDHCSSELAGEAESLANKRAMVAFRKTVDGLLTGEQIRAFRARFKLTQDVAASIFGGGKVAFSRYENDDIAQSTSMDRLIRLCMRRPTNIGALAEELSIELPAGVRDAMLSAGASEHAAFMSAVKAALKALPATSSPTAKTCANDHQFQRYGERAKVPAVCAVAPWLCAAAA